MKRQYFNLIELLLIITILVIFLSTFLPAFFHNRADGLSLRISCASNLKQLGSTMFMYAGDYNDTFPAGTTSNNATTTLDATAGGLNRLIFLTYLTDTAEYICPGTPDAAAKTGNTITTFSNERTCSYAYAPGLMTGTSNIYGNPDSALVADMTGLLSKRGVCNHNRYPKDSKFGKYGNILFQGLHVKGFSARNHIDWFLFNYGSAYDPVTKKGSKDSSWAITGQYLY